jgi:hypothetical protein
MEIINVIPGAEADDAPTSDEPGRGGAAGPEYDPRLPSRFDGPLPRVTSGQGAVRCRNALSLECSVSIASCSNAARCSLFQLELGADCGRLDSFWIIGRLRACE